MKDIFKEFLFQKHVLVNDSPIFYASVKEQRAASFATIVALAKKFSIRITTGADLVSESMIDDAARYLGWYVPEPFYKGFPESVRELTSEQLLYDQLLHYTQTYGMGWFEEAGHSVVEEVYERIGFNEYDDGEPKDFIVYAEHKAIEYLKYLVFELLEGNRPLNVDQIEVVKAAVQDFGSDILPPWIPCKDTVIWLLYDSKNLDFCKFLKLSDTIKLLQYIQFTKYGSENLKKLNLKNQDRKFLTKVIDWFEEADMKTDAHYCDYLEAFAKRKIWCGLFHHIHYRNKLNYGLMGRFISDVRSNKNNSHYHYFERYMREGNYPAAASYLKSWKGESALIRNLNYILSRCGSEHDIEEVLKCLE